MKKHLFILAILALSFPLFGQNIYSGIYDIDDYYFDFNPDTNLYQPQNNEVNTLDIDLNGDGTDDFRFSSLYREGSQWYCEKGIGLESLGQNQIAIAGTDSCWSNDPSPIFVYATYPSLEMNWGQLINNNLRWTDSVANLSFYEFSATYPTNFGFSCRRDSQFQSDTGYIAVRVFSLNDTLYGWIKISDVNWASCVIHEFACNDNSTIINSFDLFPKIAIHPNPSNGHFIVDVSGPSTKIESIKVFNVFRLLKEIQLSNQNSAEVDLSFLPDGLYFLQIETSDGRREIEKIIISKNQ